MEYVLQGLEPAEPLRWFEELSRIPRGSGNERAATDFLMAFAAARGLAARRDEALNVVIEKPASPGMEAAAPLVLQGHVDMVCEKNAASTHDFTRDPIRLIREGDLLRADGTTLGADDGVAVGLMLAALDDDTLAHPPLECLFTTGEETGLFGAGALRPESLRGRRLINMDMCNEGFFTCSCAGGDTFDLTLPAVWEEPDPESFAALRLFVTGLAGGHSGVSIGEGRQNCLRLWASLLARLGAALPLRLAALAGGDKSNAIPRECACVIVTEKENIGKAIALTAAFEAAVRPRLTKEDESFAVKAEPLPLPALCLTARSTREACELALLLPAGPVLRDMAADGFVMASQNFASARLRDNELLFCVSLRSADDAVMTEMRERLLTLAGRFGAQVRSYGAYPAWPRDSESALRAVCMRLYEEQTGKKAQLSDTHGGTECGYFRRIWPDMDLVCCGPDFFECHTPSERLSLSSYARFWVWLKAVMAELGRG